MREELFFFLPRIGAAILAGIMLGLERERISKSAGLKTMVFVTVGSCVFTSMAVWMSREYQGVDPTRIISQIISGIGFLGAGVIFKDSMNIHGLTTASLVWVACSVGCLAGASLYTTCFLVAFLTVTLMGILRIASRKITRENDDVT